LLLPYFYPKTVIYREDGYGVAHYYKSLKFYSAMDPIDRYISALINVNKVDQTSFLKKDSTFRFENNLSVEEKAELSSLGYSVESTLGSFLTRSEEIIEQAVDKHGVSLKKILKDEAENMKVVKVSANPGQPNGKPYSNIVESCAIYNCADEIGSVEITVFPLLGKAVFGDTLYDVPYIIK
jgi:hypothetical protein